MPSSQLQKVRQEKSKKYHQTDSPSEVSQSSSTSGSSRPLPPVPPRTPVQTNSTSRFSVWNYIPSFFSRSQRTTPSNSFSSRRMYYDRQPFPYFTTAAIITQLGLFLYANQNGLHQQWLQDYGCNIFRISYYREFYRLGTSIFLHLNSNHLVSNLISHSLVWNFEHKHGSLWTMYLYATSGVASSILSTYFQPATLNQIGVGSSGSLFGFVGFTLFELLFKQEFDQLAVLLISSFSSLFPTLQQQYQSSSSLTQIDHYAHLGGLLAGIIQFFQMDYLQQSRYDKMRRWFGFLFFNTVLVGLYAYFGYETLWKKPELSWHQRLLYELMNRFLI